MLNFAIQTGINRVQTIASIFFAKAQSGDAGDMDLICITRARTELRTTCTVRTLQSLLRHLLRGKFKFRVSRRQLYT
jgi:hypothetical protein